MSVVQIGRFDKNAVFPTVFILCERPENVISTKRSARRNPHMIEVGFLFGGPVDGRQPFCRCAAFPLSGESIWSPAGSRRNVCITSKKRTKSKRRFAGLQCKPLQFFIKRQLMNHNNQTLFPLPSQLPEDFVFSRNGKRHQKINVKNAY